MPIICRLQTSTFCGWLVTHFTHTESVCQKESSHGRSCFGCGKFHWFRPLLMSRMHYFIWWCLVANVSLFSNMSWCPKRHCWRGHCVCLTSRPTSVGLCSVPLLSRSHSQSNVPKNTHTHCTHLRMKSSCRAWIASRSNRDYESRDTSKYFASSNFCLRS